MLSMVQLVGEDRHDLLGGLLRLHGWGRVLFPGDEQLERAENGLEVDEGGGVGGVRLRQARHDAESTSQGIAKRTERSAAWREE